MKTSKLNPEPTLFHIFRGVLGLSQARNLEPKFDFIPKKIMEGVGGEPPGNLNN